MNFTNRKRIVRTYMGEHDDYNNYRPYLKQDFYQRCAYCDTMEEILPIPFEIDHFIPRATFKNIKDYLDCDYNNLVYSCKKCNVAKGNKFSGEINSDNPTNELFYDPVKYDYNDIFYRNDCGIIVSDDPKAKNMIAAMRLYRPIYALAWIIEQGNCALDLLDKRIEETQNKNEMEALSQVKFKLLEYVHRITRIFTANYNGKNQYN